MLTASIARSIAHPLDKLVLYAMHWRLPDSFEESHHHAPTFERVLAETAVNLQKTVISQLAAPGEHPIWLHTMDGELMCRVRVQLAVDPEAPLILYHHGFNELPYTSSWRRIFRQPSPFPAHTVCIQAPFHHQWLAPFDEGFVSLQSVYQMFAGSLRMMALMQSCFEEAGAAYTVLAGVSWGGVTSMVYEGLWQRARAVIPMLSSPDLAQVIWDIATLFDRPISVPLPQLKGLLDFTPYYRRCQPERVFPLLGQDDLFFRMEKHAAVYGNRPLVTIPGGHITAYWQSPRLRQHILNVLHRVEDGAV